MSWATDEGTRRSMRGNRRRDTSPELAVRRLLYAAGLRYRVDFPPEGGRRRADIVFARRKFAVFIDGCFWHGCPQHATLPKRNSDYWGPKLIRNIERDRETDAALRESGWTVVRFWEHEDPSEVASAIVSLLADQTDRRPSAPRMGTDGPGRNASVEPRLAVRRITG